MSGELELLKWIRARLGRRSRRILVDSGDDAAVLRIGRASVLFKVDSVIESVHFTARDPLEKVGFKALARPLSDIAAMGGIPLAALSAVALRRGMSLADAKRLVRGMERLEVPVVGGDVSAHEGPLVLSVSVLGEMRGVRPVLRRGARNGDLLLVTGPLGGSRRGRHLVFPPRLREGRLFATRLRVHAMIDISDGLARDLGHLCQASGVGADLEEASIPVSPGATLHEALHAGEDYELLVAADARTARRIEREGAAVAIGRFRAGRGIRLVGRDGASRSIEPRGYEHRFGS
ncbi:MAG: thiamine-monophosphate kinase [Planctomycetes bacterium]|nr:thiamine-monophosphate kinase [Planctomycetota bacterium]